MAATYNHSAKEIQDMVRNMDISKETHKDLKLSDPEQYLNILREENATLVDFYPAVFALHADEKLDETFFYMLDEKRKMEKGETTEDDASVRIGQKLFNKWVAPIVNGTTTPTNQSYSEYYKNIKRS